MGFAFAPSIIVLHYYFEKRFVIANGLAFAGIACGEVVWPLVLQRMIRAYGWKGALLLMSAIELHLVVCGSLMVRPRARLDANSHNHVQGLQTSKPPTRSDSIEMDVLEASSGRMHPRECSDEERDGSVVEGSVNQGFTDVIELDAVVVDEVIRQELEDNVDEDARQRASSHSSVSSIISCSSSSCASPRSFEPRPRLHTDPGKTRSASITSFEPRPRLFSDPGKTFNLFMFGLADEEEEEEESGVDERIFYRRASMQRPDVERRRRGDSVLSQLSVSFIKVMKRERFLLMRPISRYPFFVAVLPIMLLHGIGWYAVMAHLIPFAVNYGIPEQTAYDLIPIVGVGSIFGCLTHGWFIDKNMVSSDLAKIGSLAMMSVITFAYPAAHFSIEAMLCLSLVYGVAAGVSLPLFFALVSHLLPPEDINAGVCLLIIAEMLGDTIGGVCAGKLRHPM